MSRLDAYRRELDYCTYCPKLCTFACPVSNAESRESVTPWAKMTLANLLRKGLIKPTAEQGDPFYHCLACRLCTTYCKHENEVGEVLTHARAALVDAGVVHPALEELRRSMDSFGNPYAESLAENWRSLIPESRRVKGAQAVYFPGCAAVKEWPDEAEAAFELFDGFGMDFISAYEGEQLCCGLPLYRAGFFDRFAAHAKKLGESLLNYKLIVTSCPACAYTFRALYPEMGVPLGDRVKLVMDAVRPHLDNRTPRVLDDGKVVYHDNSYLARYLGQTRAPADLIHTLYGERCAEMVWSGVSAYPSGALDSYSTTHPQYAKIIAGERMRQAREVHADSVVTVSPRAAAALDRARETGDPAVTTLTRAMVRGYLTPSDAEDKA